MKIRHRIPHYCMGCRRWIGWRGLHRPGCFVAERDGLKTDPNPGLRVATGPAPFWALALAYLGILCSIGVVYLIWGYFT
ncbi:MAG: hypothetical protein AAF848_10795 [Pseudomonadota bacterium]